MKITDEQLEKIRKVYQLTKQGIKGERIAAEEMLRRLMVKYNITLDHLEDEVSTQSYVFPCKQKQYRRLFWQLFLNMFGHEKASNLEWIPSTGEVFMTAIDYLEFKPFFDFYYRQYKDEKRRISKSFLHAFVIKHHLYSLDSEQKSSISQKELKELMEAKKLAGNLSDAEYRKSLDNKN